MTDRGPRSLLVPIAAERYRAQDRLSALIAPPYDVLSPPARDVLASGDPQNIVHLTLPRGVPDPYAAAAQLLARWRAEGVLVRDPAPSAYVVQQEFQTPDGRVHLRTGMIAGLSAEGYDSGRVRPHERTHRGPKEDRLSLGRATRAALEPIFVLARDPKQHLQRRLEGVTKHQPTALADLDGVVVRVWRIGGVQAQEIAHVVGDGPLYIADGHHRYETATALRGEIPSAARIPALVVPVGDPGLVVLPTHRIVRGEAVALPACVAAWQARFVVEARESEFDPQGMLEGLGPAPAAVVVLPQGRVMTLASRRPSDELEIAVVEQEIVQVLVRAAGPSSTVGYTPSLGEVLEVVAQGASAGILVRPTPVERVLAVSDAGGTMPPKSTYFVPKVPSGLLILPFDDAPEPEAAA